MGIEEYSQPNGSGEQVTFPSNPQYSNQPQGLVLSHNPKYQYFY